MFFSLILSSDGFPDAKLQTHPILATLRLFRPGDAFDSVFQQVVVGKQFLGLHPIFPAAPGSHAFTVKHKNKQKGKMVEGRERQSAGPRPSVSCHSGHRCLCLPGGRDPRAPASGRQLGSHAPGGCPAARALHRPEAPVGAGKAGAGRPTSRQPPPAEPAEVAPRRRDPACGPGPRPSCPRRARAVGRPADAVAVPGEGAAGTRPRPSLSGRPSPSSSSGRRPRPRLPRTARRPRPAARTNGQAHLPPCQLFGTVGAGRR